MPTSRETHSQQSRPARVSRRNRAPRCDVLEAILEANILLIAIEIPHPGATYYGADKYTAGLIGKRCLER